MLKTVVWTMIKNGSYMCKPLSSKFKPHPCFLTIHSTLNCDVVSKTRADFLNYFETKTIHFAINVIKSEVWLIVWKLCIMFNFNNWEFSKKSNHKRKKKLILYPPEIWPKFKWSIYDLKSHNTSVLLDYYYYFLLSYLILYFYVFCIFRIKGHKSEQN